MRSKDGRFELTVRIGEETQREYVKDDKTYVESKLDTPHTILVDLTEKNGETAKWPATPYTLMCRSFADEAVHVRVFVDGVMVDKSILTPDTWNTLHVKGFETADGEIKQFLFSFPRFARDEKDRLDMNRLNKLGTITATFHPAWFDREDYCERSTVVADFTQANKKDADLAGHNNQMSTTRMGDTIEKVRNERRKRRLYNIDPNVTLAELTIYYRMARVLKNFGIEVEKRDVSKELKRLYPSTFSYMDDAPGGSAAGSSAGAASDDAAGRPIKMQRQD